MQAVPLGVTGVASNQVDAAGVRSVRNLPAIVPNFSATDSADRSFGDIFGIRGVTNTRFFSDPAVVIYVDDVPYGSASSFSTELFDVDHIDVFRGPQGSVFGGTARPVSSTS